MASFEVACRRKARATSPGGIPRPSSRTRMREAPPSSISTSMTAAPASSAFSKSSFTTDAGRSMTSPAAMRAATSGGSTRMGGGRSGPVGSALILSAPPGVPTMTASRAPDRRLACGACGRERTGEGTARLLTRIAAATLSVLLVALAASDVPRPPDAEVLPPLPGADVLLALPRAGIEPHELARALARLGHETLPVPGLAGAARVRVPAGTDPGELARELAASGLARAVEEDGIVRVSRTPGDPLYPELQSSYMEVVRAPEAWGADRRLARGRHRRHRHRHRLRPPRHGADALGEREG